MGDLWRWAALASIAVLAACDPPPLVVQGTVTAVDAAARTVTLRDELPPNRALVLSLEEAEIGSAPAVQDLVRVAYRERGSRLVALRLMNLTHQEELTRRRREPAPH